MLVILPYFLAAQGTSISSTGANPDNSSMLDIISTTKGLLFPRMTTAQRDGIAAPANSLFIFNTTTQCFEAFSTSTSQWHSLNCLGCQLPGAFIATAATSVTGTSFSANWNASAGATTYYLDVSTSSTFASFVTGFNNLPVGNVITYNVTGLPCGGTYYYRVRANNVCGTSSNSNPITVVVGSCDCATPQVWMAANMNTGTQVTQATTQAAGQKWCYNNVVANCTTYGGLYQWASAMNLPSTANSTLQGGAWQTCDPCGSGGIQGICPAGYHIPTDLEWSRYEYCIENNIAPTGNTTLATFQTTSGSWRGSTIAGVGPGAKMKVTSSNSPAWDGTNTSGFSALPTGYISSSTSFDMGTYTYFRTTTEFDASNAWYRSLCIGFIGSFRNKNSKTNGFSVRCLQN
ncbi:MAG: hypothetical protein A2275_03230 [Bacteroidetes bacterium RIFOXYA12_FULL_35_11]|nr:MAG: hypothetical protein A2275_03230 [Bacteroidetes bacterium RIFOXYA12_FULL_35_11]